MPEKHFYSRCNCGKVLEGILGWTRIDYIAHIDRNSDLALKAQAHHDKLSIAAHNNHTLYNSEEDAENRQNRVGFIVVSSANYPQGELKEGMDIQNEER